MQLFDSHAHYNDEKFDEDRQEIIKKVYESGVKKIVCAGYNVKSSKEAVEIANNYEYIYAIVSISPNDIPNIETTQNELYEKMLQSEIEQIKQLAKNKKVVAIRRNRVRLLLEQRKQRTTKISFYKTNRTCK